MIYKHGLEIVNIESWHGILNWKNTPNYQTCHRHDSLEKFESEYYKNSEIDNLIKNIFDFINTEGSSNAKLMGRMGSGKTTFLHYIRRILIEDDTVSNKVFFSIIRAGKIPKKNYKEGLEYIFINTVFKNFFKLNNHSEAYARILELDIDDELKLLRLQHYYLDSENFFKRRLIVVLDDIDTLLKEDDVINVTNSFKQICGSGDAINKWVSIRETTFENYSQGTQDIFTFFQEEYTLPSVSLYDIVKKRIIAKNGNEAINPFSEDLCKKVLKLSNGSLRNALGMISMIIKHTKPPEKKQGESFLQNWFEKSAVTVLLKKHKIPNLHTPDYIIAHNYPIAYDVIQIIAYTGIKTHIFKLVADIAARDRGNLFNGKYILIEKQLEMVLGTLIQHEVVYYNQLTEELTLSQKAEAIISFPQETYNNICKMLSEVESIPVKSEYWDTLSPVIRYDLYVRDINIVRSV